MSTEESSLFLESIVTLITKAEYNVVNFSICLYKETFMFYKKTHIEGNTYYAPNYRDSFWFAQDNIKDKMRSVPIEMSAEIVGAKRQRTRNGLPQLMPILDSSQPSKDVIEVNIQTTAFIFELMTKCSRWSKVFNIALLPLVVLQVNFVKEGCGSDHVCRSKLKMGYKLYYKQNNLEEYQPLPTWVLIFQLF